MDTNPPKSQDRVHDTFEHFERFGYIMFPQQKKMYENIAQQCRGSSVIEVGCGAGIGSAILDRKCELILATDVSLYNIEFARELYPWINFDVWDLSESKYLASEIVVGIEVIEHVPDARSAINHMLMVAWKEIWFTTPNGNMKLNPPSNPYHVYEYPVKEMLEIVPEAKIYHWETMEPLTPDTLVDPLIYKVEK